MKTNSTPVPTYLSSFRFNSLMRAGLLVAAIALIGIPLFSSSSASSARKSTAPSPERTTVREAAKTPGANRAATNPLSAFFFQGGTPSIATYDSGCTTADVDFELNTAVCATATSTGAPTFGRRITWVDPSGYIRQSVAVSSDTQSDTFAIPADSTSELSNGQVVKNTGTWRVNLTSSRGSIITSSDFFVSNQAAAEVDLLTIKRAAAVQVAAGSEAIYTILVENLGPNAAQSVVVTDVVPTNTTFADLTQSGAVFNCTTPAVDGTGSVNCTIGSLARGASTVFVLSLNVLPGTPNGTTIVNTATTTTTTIEVNPDNNTATVKISVDNSVAEACVLTCPADMVVTANTTVGGNFGAFVTFSAASVAGSCGSVSNNPASGSFFAVGTHTVTSTSSTGATCTFTVKVLGTSAPTISCPPNVTATAGGDGTATVSVGTPTFTPAGASIVGVRSDGTPAVFDDDGILVTPAVNPALTDPYPTGITGITWTVTDADGRTASCRQTVTVNAVCGSDTERPTITAPANITVFTGPDNTGCTVALDDELGQAEANDNCSVTVTISGIPAGNEFPIGSTTLTYTATDPAGNTNLTPATQVVTVIDDTPPKIQAPDDASYVCPSAVPAASASQATRGVVLDEDGIPLPPGPPFDNCGTPAVTVTETDNGGAGSASSPLVITRVFTATDGAAVPNSASSTQTITVIDAEAPTITAPDDAAYQCASEVPAAAGSQATAADNCAAPSVGVSESNNGGAGTTASPLVITRNYTATDAAGNQASDSQTITVIDNTPPTITAPADAAYQCASEVPAAAGSQATAADNCAAPTVGVSESNNGGAGTTASPLVITRNYTATDAAGNQASDSQTITVIDNTPPTITPPANVTVYLPLNSTATSMVVNYPNPATASDNCSGSVTLSYSPASGSTFSVGTTTVTVTGTDDHGNSATATFTVTVLYNFTGFFSPVSNAPTLNAVNAGRAIPVKFSLSGDKGLNIFAVNNPYSVSLNCSNNDPGVDVTETVTAGSSSLSYGGDQYVYIWKTESSWAGTCRQLVVTLNDGSVHVANFKFR